MTSIEKAGCKEVFEKIGLFKFFFCICFRSSKKSILYSDYHADEDSKNGNLGQRSVSLVSFLKEVSF